MGHNKLGNLVKEACARAGIAGKKTNHSIRKSTAADLTAAGLPPHKVIRITGHKNISSIKDYDTELSYNEHREISNILCGGASISRSSASQTQIIFRSRLDLHHTHLSQDRKP